MTRYIAYSLTMALLAATAHADIMQNFGTDGQPVLAPTQTPGAYYPDRYQPAVFESSFFDGDDRLHIEVNSADSEANRPASFSSGFYNTQGRKFDTPGENSFSIDLYVGSDWDTVDRNTGMWGTAIDAANAISGYPILAFRNVEAGGAFPPVDSGFYFYTQDTDQDDSNGYTDGYVPVADLDSGDFGKWYTLSFAILDDKFEASVADSMGTTIGSFSDIYTFGSESFSNMIVNTYNFGDTYDVYYDNFTATNIPEPSTIALAGLALGGLAFRRRRRA